MAKAKKTGSKKPSIVIPKLTLSMPLDEEKVKAIQRCIAKGTLKITISKMDLGARLLGEEAWIYD
jgi:anti-sigma28 factor (negative regulator of flagellin synthesis)